MKTKQGDPGMGVKGAHQGQALHKALHLLQYIYIYYSTFPMQQYYSDHQLIWTWAGHACGPV